MQKKVLEIVEFYYYFNENIPALRLKSTSNKTDYSIVNIHYQKKSLFIAIHCENSIVKTEQINWKGYKNT